MVVGKVQSTSAGFGMSKLKGSTIPVQSAYVSCIFIHFMCKTQVSKKVKNFNTNGSLVIPMFYADVLHKIFFQPSKWLE